MAYYLILKTTKNELCSTTSADGQSNAKSHKTMLCNPIGQQMGVHSHKQLPAHQYS